MKKKWILGIMLSLCLGLIGGMVALTYDFVTPPNQTEEKASEADTFPLDWTTELFEGGGSNMVDYTEFRFEKTAPTGFVYKGVLPSASNIKVYINETRVAFVDSNTIYAQDGFNFMDFAVDYPVNYIFNNFDTSNLTSMGDMFQGCYIGEIDLKSFNTANVTGFGGMFQDAIITNVLDLSSFVINEGASVDRMLDLDTNHEHMKILVAPKTVGTEISITTGSALFDGSTGNSKTSITTSDAGKAFVTADSGYFMPDWKTWLAEQDVGITLYSVTGAVIEFPTTTHISFEKEAPSGYNDTGKAMSSGVKLYQSSTTATDIAFVFDGTIYAPVSCNKLFSGYNLRHTIIFNNFNTSLVTDMSYMFSMSAGNCVTYLDLSNFDTSNVTNMKGMFYSGQPVHDTYIESIDLSSFDTSNVTDMSNMFSGTPVKNLDLSSFNTSNVTDMQAMFYRASQLKKLDLSNFDTSKCDGCWVKNALYGGTFASCTNLEILNLSGVVLKDRYSQGFSKLLDGDSNLKIVVAPKSMASQIAFYNNKSMIEVSSGTAKTAIATSDTGKVFVSADSGYFMPNWKTWLANQSVGVTYSTATSIKFLSTAPDGYTDTGKVMASGIKLYQSSTTATDIAFVFDGTIYAPVSCSELFYNCSKVTTLTFDNFNTQLVTSMSEMFYSCNALTSLDLSGFDTSNVTSMDRVFYYCSKLTELDLSGFNTSKVTTFWEMFGQCQKLVSIDFSGFDTSNATSMSYMFSVCTSLTDIDLSGFDTSKVTSMYRMFASCNSLTSLDLSSFDTSNVTSMYQMFYYCMNLTNLDISSFDTSKVTDMELMFGNCEKLTNLDVSGFNTSKVTNMKGMFSYCKCLTSLDVSNFDTSQVKNMSSMFCDLEKITNLDLSNFNTENVTNMSTMFFKCYMLDSLDLSNFNTTKVTSMSNMFYWCGVSTLNVSSFDTAKVTNMEDMFYCSKLRKLDISNFTVGASTRVSTFYLTSIKEIKTPKSVGVNIPISSSNVLIDSLTGAVKTSISTTDTNRTFIGYPIFASWKTYLQSANVGVTYDTATEIHFLRSTPEGYTDTGKKLGNSDISIYVNGTAVAFVCEEQIYAPVSCSELFYNCSKVKIMTFENFNTQITTDMSEMFYRCGVTSLDLSGFDTSNVTNMHYMFYSCDYLTDLNVSSFNTSNVTIIWGMFEECRSLTSLDVSNFDVSNAENLGGMFSTCASLTSLDVSNFDTSKTKSMSGMFEYCRKLTSLDLSNFDTSNVTYMGEMFLYCDSMTSLNLSSFNTSKVTYMGHMFENCSKLTNLDLGSFDTSNVTSMYQMFYNCSALTELNVSSFDTSKVTDMRAMFACPNLKTLDISNFVIREDVSLSNNGYYLSNIKLLKTPKSVGKEIKIYTNNVLVDSETRERKTSILTTDTNRTFVALEIFPTTWKTDLASASVGVTYSGATEIHFLKTAPTGYTNTEKKLGSTDISIYTNGTAIAFVCESIIYAPASCKELFYGCSKVTSMTFYNFDTSLATDMSGMFCYVSSITHLDLSSFDTSNVTSMYQMFASCSALKSLDLSNFNTQKVTTMENMFNGSFCLETLDLSSFDTSNVTSMYQMFASCYALQSLDLSNFNTEKVTTMYRMFAYCKTVSDLDLSSFNTEKVTVMSDMFYACNGLKTLNLSSFTTPSDYISSMLYFTYTSTNKILKIYTPKSVGATISISTNSALYDTTTGERKTSIATTDAGKVFAAKIDLTVDADGGECDVSTVGVYYDTPIGENGMASLPTPTKKGAEFLGWRKNYFDTVDFMNHFNNYGNPTYRVKDEYKSTLIDYKKLKMYGCYLGSSTNYDSTTSQSLNSNKIEANAGWTPGLVQGGWVYIYWKPTSQLIAGKYRLSYNVENLEVINSDNPVYASIVPIKKSSGSLNVVNKYGEAYINATTCTLASGANTSESATSSCSAIYEVDSNFLGFILQGGYSAYFENIKFELIETADGSDYPAEAKVSSESIYNTLQSISAIWKVLPVNVTVKIMTESDSGIEGVYNTSVNGLSSATMQYTDATSGNRSSKTLGNDATTKISVASGTDIQIYNFVASDGYALLGVTTTGNLPKTNEKIEEYSSDVLEDTTFYVWMMKTDYANVKYDETDKYFYIESNETIQSYVGDSMNSTLNNYFTADLIESKKVKDWTISNHGEKITVSAYTYSDGTNYACVTAPKTTTLNLSGVSVSVTAGGTYWFKFEPIRWRLSDYGVSSTDFPKTPDGADGNLNGYGSRIYFAKVVTDKIVWGNSLTDGAYDAGAGFSVPFNLMTDDGENPNSYWGLTGNNNYARASSLSSNLQASYQEFGEIDKDVPTTKTGAMLERYASEEEIDMWMTDKRAKVTDFVAFLMGIDTDSYAKYWTRELGSKYYNVKAIGSNGVAKDAWTTNFFGVRLSMTLSTMGIY